MLIITLIITGRNVGEGILHFWKRWGPQNLALARMARDFLGIQGVTTQLERNFSEASGQLSPKQSSMGHKTIRDRVMVYHNLHAVPHVIEKDSDSDDDELRSDRRTSDLEWALGQNFCSDDDDDDPAPNNNGGSGSVYVGGHRFRGNRLDIRPPNPNLLSRRRRRRSSTSSEDNRGASSPLRRVVQRRNLQHRNPRNGPSQRNRNPRPRPRRNNNDNSQASRTDSIRSTINAQRDGDDVDARSGDEINSITEAEEGSTQAGEQSGSDDEGSDKSFVGPSQRYRRGTEHGSPSQSQRVYRSQRRRDYALMHSQGLG